MTIGDFVTCCKAPYNSITIIEQDSGDGSYFTSMNDIPETYYDAEIIIFYSGYSFDISGSLFGLSILI